MGGEIYIVSCFDKNANSFFKVVVDTHGHDLPHEDMVIYFHADIYQDDWRKILGINEDTVLCHVENAAAIIHQ